MATMHSPRSALPDRPGGGVPPTHHLRTTVIAVGVSLAAAATVVVPFALRDGGHRAATASRAPTPATASAPVTPDAESPGGPLVGDVDGDGTPDTVTLARPDRLTVALGSGGTARHPLQDRPRLVGLADIGAPGLAVVTSSQAGRHRYLTAWRLHGVVFDRVRTQHGALLSNESELAAWVSDHTLYDGSLDPLQQGADRVVVVSRAWKLHAGVLAPTDAGIQCWDRSTEAPPAPCPVGTSYAYDVGPHADLPTLLPAVPRATAGDSGVVTGNHDHWTLRRVSPPGVSDSPTYDLVVSGRGATRTVRIQAGWPPTLAATPVSVGELTDGVLVSQEGGDSDTWRVYVDWAGGIVELATKGPISLGGGFATDGDSAYLSWLGADGRPYTRLGTSTPGRYRVWTWEPEGATAYTPPALVAKSLGVVCIDDTLSTYGTCAS